MHMSIVYNVQRVATQLPYRGSMELKTARLTLLIDPNKKAAFERLCAQLDLTASQVVRQLIRDFLAQHGASYVPSGHEDDAPDAPDEPPAARPRTSAPDATAKPGRTRTARRKG